MTLCQLQLTRDMKTLYVSRLLILNLLFPLLPLFLVFPVLVSWPTLLPVCCPKALYTIWGCRSKLAVDRTAQPNKSDDFSIAVCPVLQHNICLYWSLRTEHVNCLRLNKTAVQILFTDANIHPAPPRRRQHRTMNYCKLTVDILAVPQTTGSAAIVAFPASDKRTAARKACII